MRQISLEKASKGKRNTPKSQSNAPKLNSDLQAKLGQIVLVREVNMKAPKKQQKKVPRLFLEVVKLKSPVGKELFKYKGSLNRRFESMEIGGREVLVELTDTKSARNLSPKNAVVEAGTKLFGPAKVTATEVPPRKQEERLEIIFKRSLAQYNDQELMILAFEDEGIASKARRRINRDPLLKQMPRTPSGATGLLVPAVAIPYLKRVFDGPSPEDIIRFSVQSLFDTDRLSNQDLSQLRQIMQPHFE